MVIVKKQVCNQSAFFTIVCKKEVTSKFDLIFTKLSSLYMYICYHTQNSMFTKGGSRNGGRGFESYLPTLLPTSRFILQILTDRSFQLCNIRKSIRKNISLQLANFKFC